MSNTHATLFRATARALAGLVLSAGLGAAAQPALAWEDAVTLGFKPMLTHSPYAGPTALNSESGFDPLLLAMAKAQRRQQESATDGPPTHDAVAAGFQRMLAQPAPAPALAGTPRVGADATARIKRRLAHSAPVAR